MATDRISSTASLVERMRALASERTRETGRGGVAGSQQNADKNPAGVQSKEPAEALRHRLRDLLKTTDQTDVKAAAQARDSAVREILLWEFGSDFRTDSQFLPMVDAITKTLDADPGFTARFGELVEGLKST